MADTPKKRKPNVLKTSVTFCDGSSSTETLDVNSIPAWNILSFCEHLHELAEEIREREQAKFGEMIKRSHLKASRRRVAPRKDGQ